MVMYGGLYTWYSCADGDGDSRRPLLVLTDVGGDGERLSPHLSM